MNRTYKQFIGPLIFFSVMFAVAFQYYSGITSLVKTSDWVAHTHRVIGFGNLIQKLLVDMETGERGFLITGKKNFLEPYEKGKEEYLIVIAHTKTLVSDNSEQVKLLDEIDALVHKWQRLAAIPEINTRIEVNKDQATTGAVTALIEKETGKAIMDELRSKLSKFNSVEKNLLTKRRKDARKVALRSSSFAVVGTFLAAIIGFFSFGYIFRKVNLASSGNRIREISLLAGADERNVSQTNNAQYTIYAPIIILLVLITALILLVLNKPVENQNITAGKGYGFEVGENKLTTYERASLLEADGEIYGIRVGDDKNLSNIFTDISKSNYLILKHYNEWYIEYNVKRIGMNTVHLSFADDKLNKITKNYQAIILPTFVENILSGKRGEQ